MRYFSIFSLIVTFIIVGMVPMQAKAEIVLVVNSASSVTELTERQVVNIYTGRVFTLPNGEKIEPYGYSDSSSVREEFYGLLVNKTIAEINAYWARILFSGRAKPPKQLSDTSKLLKLIQENPNTIAYLDSNDLIDGMKVVFRLGE